MRQYKRNTSCWLAAKGSHIRSLRANCWSDVWEGLQTKVFIWNTAVESCIRSMQHSHWPPWRSIISQKLSCCLASTPFINLPLHSPNITLLWHARALCSTQRAIHIKVTTTRGAFIGVKCTKALSAKTHHQICSVRSRQFILLTCFKQLLSGENANEISFTCFWGLAFVLLPNEHGLTQSRLQKKKRNLKSALVPLTADGFIPWPSLTPRPKQSRFTSCNAATILIKVREIMHVLLDNPNRRACKY